MRAFLLLCSYLLISMTLNGCGQEGAAIAPGSGSTLQEVKADCNGQSCI